MSNKKNLFFQMPKTKQIGERKKNNNFFLIEDIIVLRDIR